MGKHSDEVLTEAYRDKNYERSLTDLYFDVMKQLKICESFPSIEYARTALAESSNFIEAVVLSPHHLKLYGKTVEPVIDDIRTILHGDPRLPSVISKSAEYNVYVVQRYNKPELRNGLFLILQLKQAIFLMKQWAYEQGMFLIKPIDRKFGVEAIEEALQQ